MKTSFKAEIRNFEVTGMTTLKQKEVGEIVSLAFAAEAKGRLVAWNKITGDVAISVARIAAKGFGPKDVSFRDFDWVVHILRRGKPVTRHMKSTPRKNTINHALTHLLVPALLDDDTAPGAAKKVTPKVASKRTRKPKAEQPVITSDLSGLVDNLEAVGLKVMTEVPKVPESTDDLLTVPEFLKR